MENKIYQQCRKEAKCILAEKRDKEGALMFSREDLDQLTAELYAQKFADWIQPSGDKNYYNNAVRGGEYFWIITYTDTYDTDKIGTTAQLHEKFVEENKGGGDE